MTEMMVIKKVTLGRHHVDTGLTKHTLIDSEGSRPFSKFTSFEITRYPAEQSCYLMHICADGTGTDTWHESLEDALHQANWEFGVQTHEWTDLDEPFK